MQMADTGAGVGAGTGSIVIGHPLYYGREEIIRWPEASR